LPQLDLFDRLADEDLRDANENERGCGDDDEDDEDDEDGAAGGGAARRGDKAEPQAVKRMRELVEAVEGNEALSVEVELLVDKLLALGGGGTGAGEGCGLDLWRRVR